MTVSVFQRRILMRIGRGHASAQEIARDMKTSPASIGRAVLGMSRSKPKLLHASSHDGFDSPGWDDQGNTRVELTKHGLEIIMVEGGRK